MVWEYKVVEADTGASSTIQYTRQLNSLGEQGWEMCAETAAEFLVFKRAKGEGLSEEVLRLREENKRLREELQQPKCHSCHSLLGDNWCADCAGKADRERFEHFKKTGQDLFAPKTVCNICGDPNCYEPNQKH